MISDGLIEEYGKGKTHKKNSFVTQADLFFLDDLGFVEIGHGVFAVVFILRVWLASTIHLEEFLDTVVAGCDNISAFLDEFVFGFDFFEKVLNLSW